MNINLQDVELAVCFEHLDQASKNLRELYPDSYISINLTDDKSSAIIKIDEETITIKRTT